MASASQWKNLLGEWQGTNQLWLSPDERAYESESTASVSIIAQGQFIEITSEGQEALAVLVHYSVIE